uniref:Uncharacterized protein n=1 Tax=Panagrolaimus sp. PS1159 TaxID=55785 RepID=A0AC35GE05_9BILA
EAPCVFVPTNTTAFLTPVIGSLVSSQPSLLLSLLPKIVHHPNAAILITALKDAWVVLNRFEEEQLNEVFSLLVSATSEHTPFSALMLNDVWPVLGKQEQLLNSLLNHMLQSPHNLMLLTEITQALVINQSSFSNIVIARIMTELQSAMDPNLPKLLAFLLVMSFNAPDINIEIQLSNLMHITTCLAGCGSRFIRCAVFG